jgi:hypothetical protein
MPEILELQEMEYEYGHDLAPVREWSTASLACKSDYSVGC